MKTQKLIVVAALALGLSIPASAGASLPDLCDDIYLDSTGLPIHDSNGVTLSRFCEWTNEGSVELWSDNVCCSVFADNTSRCTPTGVRGRCGAGMKMWCDYAVVELDGTVTCQQPLQDTCGAGFCVSAPGAGPFLAEAEPLCCQGNDDCFVVNLDNPQACLGGYMMCDTPFTNTDGTVGCADDE